MNTEFAKEMMAEYRANFDTHEKDDFRGYKGSDRYSYAAGAFYQLCKMMVEELDRKAAK